LISNNVLCISVDRDGNVWLGTDKGVTCYNNGKLINYQ
jgi:ligand-binding sensor domain-containing protein